MKVTLKLNNETEFSVTIPDNSTVEDLKIASKVACPVEYNEIINNPNHHLKLWYSGKLLELSKDLSHYGISSSSIIHITSNNHSSSALDDSEESTTTTTTTTILKKARRKSSNKKSNKCNLQGCNSTALRLVGDCTYCQGKFCSKHRLLENHSCSSLKNCKDLYHERNALKLQNEQTISSKV